MEHTHMSQASVKDHNPSMLYHSYDLGKLILGGALAFSIIPLLHLAYVAMAVG